MSAPEVLCAFCGLPREGHNPDVCMRIVARDRAQDARLEPIHNQRWHEVACIALRALLRHDAYADPHETARRAEDFAEAIYPGWSGTEL